MALMARRVLLDFSVIAPGGSMAYANGFLNALPEVWPEYAREGLELMVVLPSGALLAGEENLLRTAGVTVHRLSTATPGAWAGRLLPHITLPWLAFRVRATDVFVPRDIAPALVRGRLTILARNVLVWSKPRTMSDGWVLRFMRVTGRLSLRRASRVLAATATIHRLLPPFSAPRHVVFHGCDLPPMNFEEKHRSTAERPVLRVVGLGTISAYKRFDVLIETVRTLQDHGVAVELDIWGPLLDEAEAVRLRDLGRVQLGRDPLRGPLDPSRRAWLFRSADVMMMGSSTESFGFPMVEAMRTSTIVVAPRSGLVDEICGSCAVTYTEGSGRSAAEAILEARQDFALLAARGLRRSEDLFTWRRCVHSTLEALFEPAS